jgi:hypothetical protein
MEEDEKQSVLKQFALKRAAMRGESAGKDYLSAGFTFDNPYDKDTELDKFEAWAVAFKKVVENND